MTRASRSSRNHKTRRSPYRLRLEPLETRFLLATFNVNSNADLVDVNPGNGLCETATSGGVCTLRAAIQETNALANTDSTGDAVPDPDVINVPAGTYTLTITGTTEDAAATGDLDITQDLTIQRAAGETNPVIIQAGTLGPNDDSVNGGNGIDRVFDVPDLGSTTRVVNVNMSDVTVQHGKSTVNGGGIQFGTLGLLTLTRVMVTDNSSGLFGGGVFVRRGDMNVSDSTIMCNLSASDGGGIDSALSGPSVVTITNSTIFFNVARGNGGGIFNDLSGTLTLTNSTVDGNMADDGGGLFNSGELRILGGSVVSGNNANGEGGGIFNFGGLPDGGLFVTNSTISANIAIGNGGGISNNDGHAEITSSLITGNRSIELNGGGISTTVEVGPPATLIIEASTLSNNDAQSGSGGGIFNDNDHVEINHSSLRENSAVNGGGIFTRATPSGGGGGGTLDVQNSLFYLNTAGAEGFGNGGAIHNDGDSVMLSNSTVTSNSAGGSGGGLYQVGNPTSDGSMLVINVTLDTNGAPDGSNIFTDGDGPVQLGNTIVAFGTGSPSCNNFSLITSFGHNLDSANSCGFNSTTGDGDRVDTNPFLGFLQNNGGPTFTEALCEAGGVPDTSCQGRSPAIDAGDNNLSPGMADQRSTGFPRIAPTGGTIDIGAFEVQGQAPCSLIVTAIADTDNAADAVNTLREAINCANSDPDLDTITFNIPGAGPHTIGVGSTGLGQLPAIIFPVIINGYSQGSATADPSDDATVNTLALGDNAVLKIEINGSLAGAGPAGLLLNTSGSTIRGLVINRFSDDAIEVNGTGNLIEGNFLGTNIAGTAALPNGFAGVNVFGSTNTVGGTSPASRNVISGNTIQGVKLDNSFGPASGNVVQGNYIGTNKDGTADLGNGRFGINIFGSSSNTVGDTVVAARNVISGNDEVGVVIQQATATGNVIAGNYIGTNAAGTAAIANTGIGVEVVAVAGNTIGGTVGGAGNLVSGNGVDGVLLIVASGNLIAGNFVGTNAAGTAALANGDDGIDLDSSSNNTISNNLVSGNLDDGVEIDGGNDVDGGDATGNLIVGNFIGTNAAGTAAIPNLTDGVSIQGASMNTIGGTTAAARNVISGNGFDGVFLVDFGSTNNLIQGNFIGVNVTGSAALPNGDDGVDLDSGPSNNTIGGTAAGAGNVISGNGENGVTLEGADANLVQGNFIGTNAAGAAALPNSGPAGVDIIFGSTDNTIGGSTPGARNVISGNSGHGVLIENGANGNLVQGNLIGTQADGVSALGNNNSNIHIDASSNNRIVSNTIAFSTETDTGVSIISSTGNTISMNSIFSNVGLGIDLDDDGVTENDLDDNDSGANNLLNFPVVETATISGDNLTLTGFARPNVEIELFIVDADPSGFGEGKTFLTMLVEGSADDSDATTGSYGPGNVNGLNQGTDNTNRFSFTIPTPAGVSVGTVLTATATEPQLARGVRQFPTGSTSEFSGNITVEGVVTQFDFGDAANTYATLLSSNGPRHQLGIGLAFHCVDTIGFGIVVDADADGQPSTFADGDDLDADGFDEEGVQISTLTAGSSGNVTVCATASGRLDAFIDFNDDGDFADSGEKIFNNLLLSPGTNPLIFSVPASATGGADGVTFSRFRISTAGGLSFNGPALDGEVEDHSVDIVQPPQFDFGDAPASFGNPSHQLRAGPVLGDDIDSEASGQPNSTATGDDVNGSPDDETGVTFVGPILVDNTANVNVVVSFVGPRGKSESARLDAFLDFNRDGDFSDTGEQIFTNRVVFEGTNALSFSVPTDAVAGLSFARFRVSSLGNLSFAGPASDGEVEDYQVRISVPGEGCRAGIEPPELGGAGNVKVRVSHGRLIIMGDVDANTFEITAGGGHDVDAAAGGPRAFNVFTVTGRGGTTINGLGSATFGGVTGNVQIRLGAGDDTLVLDGTVAGLALPGRLTIRTDGGNDTIFLDTLDVAGLTRIRAGRGDDAVAIIDAVLSDPLRARTRAGVDIVALCELTAEDLVRVRTGGSSDTVVLDDSVLNGTLTVRTGRAGDTVSIEQSGSPTGPDSRFGGRVKIRTRRGNDAICIGNPDEPGNSADFHGRTKIRGGRGHHDSLDGLNNGANTFDTPPVVVGIEQLDTGNPACGLNT